MQVNAPEHSRQPLKMQIVAKSQLPNRQWLKPSPHPGGRSRRPPAPLREDVDHKIPYTKSHAHLGCREAVSELGRENISRRQGDVKGCRRNCVGKHTRGGGQRPPVFVPHSN